MLLADGSRRILGRRLTAGETDAIFRYLALLAKWQRSQRLVGSTDPRWLVQNIVLDSLLFLQLLPPSPASIADLGSGAGVPGIPIKILRPDVSVVLIESRERRASFLAAVVRELGLQQCRVVASRAEDVGSSDRHHDAVVMRCAGELAGLVPVAAGLARPGGRVIASGPPNRPAAAEDGLDLDWVEIDGASGRRWFAIYRKPTVPWAE